MSNGMMGATESRTPCRVAMLGGGAWGSAMAGQLAAIGTPHTIWRRGDDIDACLKGAEAVIVALPARATPDAIALLSGRLGATIPVAWAAKGPVPDGDLLICEYAAPRLPNPVVMLSGPSFADEVERGLPAALVAASADAGAAARIAGLFAGSALRLYTGDDAIGTATGGAVKNVIAIAAGITAGLEMGDNARAALLTRGLAEAVRFAVALGGQQRTLFGLAGLGDMALTCGSAHSRNFAYGLALAKGEAVPPRLAEGRYSAEVIARRAQSLGIDMPITFAVARVVAGGDIKTEIARLLERPAAGEWES